MTPYGSAEAWPKVSPVGGKHFIALAGNPRPLYYDQDRQIQGGWRIFIYQPFTTTDLLNWKNQNPSFTEKPQAMIDLLQSIIWSHKPTSADCQQLLLTLFNTEECWHVTQASLKWIEEHALEGTLKVQTYTQNQFSEEDPQWDPNDD